MLGLVVMYEAAAKCCKGRRHWLSAIIPKFTLVIPPYDMAGGVSVRNKTVEISAPVLTDGKCIGGQDVTDE
ncbi:hypothetical protein UU7_09635 [Rhodanobacter spathiphylli B39]|uniref:Uncharacterized protein n=1 Tax=Rhodanobacter spathiphylli B39 TaxID=1163407 RepID=I4W138_9GAMM|nr:hypothetical protein UU7_09635 [Rhodanobacter spathiphylli B39]